MHQTRVKIFYASKDICRIASVKSNAKFSRLVPSCRHKSSTVCRIILLLTLLLLSSERRSITNVSFRESNLPTSTLTYFCFSTSASSTVKNTVLSRNISRIFSSFWDGNRATLARTAVSEGKDFPTATNRDFKAEWFSLCNCNFILFTKLPYALARRQRRDLLVFESSCHLPACLPHTAEASHSPFTSERKQENCEYQFL